VVKKKAFENHCTMRLLHRGRASLGFWTWFPDPPTKHCRPLQAIAAYISAHFLTLPDGRLHALADAAALMRTRYIGSPEHTDEKIKLLNSRPWRDLEIITAHLYRSMGYRTFLTRPGRDGGRDIIAVNDSPGRRDHIRIECKQRTGAPPRIADVRALLGIVSHERASRGVFVTTSKFSRGARGLAASDPRIELIDGRHLVLMLNEYLGSNWALRIEWWCSTRGGS
jgi:hypothetical protein